MVRCDAFEKKGHIRKGKPKPSTEKAKEKYFTDEEWFEWKRQERQERKERRAPKEQACSMSDPYICNICGCCWTMGGVLHFPVACPGCGEDKTNIKNWIGDREDPYRNLRDVHCKCNECGVAFVYWLCDDQDWLNSGYTWQAVCKPCFEKRVSDPHYLTFEEYDGRLHLGDPKLDRKIDKDKRQLIEKYGLERALILISWPIELTPKCLRCGHEWQPRVKTPKKCPNCKTIHWDRPRKAETKAQ